MKHLSLATVGVWSLLALRMLLTVVIVDVPELRAHPGTNSPFILLM